MKMRKLEKQIKNAFFSYAPQSDTQKSEFETAHKNFTEIIPMKIRTVSILAASIVFLAVVVSVIMVTIVNNKTDYCVILDVNPSIEYITDDKGKIKDIVPLNDDAEKIVPLIKATTFDEAVDSTMSLLREKKYINKKGTVLVSFVDNNLKSCNTEFVKRAFEKYNLSSKSNVVIYYQAIQSAENIKEFSENNGISLGKYSLCKKLADNDNQDNEKLKNMDISSLVKKAKRANNKESSANDKASNKPSDFGITTENQSIVEQYTHSSKIKETKTSKSNKKANLTTKDSKKFTTKTNKNNNVIKTNNTKKQKESTKTKKSAGITEHSKQTHTKKPKQFID